MSEPYMTEKDGPAVILPHPHLVLAQRLRVQASEVDMLKLWTRSGTEIREYLDKLAESMRRRANHLEENIPYVDPPGFAEARTLLPNGGSGRGR